MHGKAGSLGYGIRNAHLAHAKVQFIDFLIHRAQQRSNEEEVVEQSDKAKKPKYTHILGMGCSRKHCQECNALFQLFLGHDYAVLTAAMDKLCSEPSMPNIEECTQEDEANLRMTVPATIQNFKVVIQGDAIRGGGNRSANYRLSKNMQKAINMKSGLSLDFTNARFNPTNHTAERQSAAARLPAEDNNMHSAGEYETEEVVNKKKRKVAHS